jgi:alpha-N-acetylglucosaminidase
VLQDPRPLGPRRPGRAHSLATNGSLGYAHLAVTPQHGCALSVDDNNDGRLNKVTSAAGPVAPVTLRLPRAGDSLTAAYSPDGTTWTTLGTARPNGLAATPDVGIFMTAANGGSGATGLATFDTVSVH